MKRTASMQYTPSENAEALYICTVNDGDLYRSSIRPIIDNLYKKHQRGTFDPDKAADAFYPIATEEANRLRKQFGEVYSVTERFTCAVDMVTRYTEDWDA